MDHEYRGPGDLGQPYGPVGRLGLYGLGAGESMEAGSRVAAGERLLLQLGDGVFPRPLAVRVEVTRLHHERHLWIGVEPGTVEALEQLRAAGLRLGVVSNSDGKVDAALAAAGLRPYFELVVDSSHAGVEKPDPRIFAVAVETMGIAPAEAAYVGDVYEVDVVGARRAGLSPVLLDPHGLHATVDVPIIQSLADLPGLIAAGVPGRAFTQS